MIDIEEMTAEAQEAKLSGLVETSKKHFDSAQEAHKSSALLREDLSNLILGLIATLPDQIARAEQFSKANQMLDEFWTSAVAEGGYQALYDQARGDIDDMLKGE